MIKSDCDRIVLFAKQTGQTSFSSLFTIKHSLNTQKVGHTGTLDSFAQGLLVVCCGSLTRLAGRITEFDKTYEAVLTFGKETDTLECTGSVIAEADLPEEQDLFKAVEKFTGRIMQVPPSFSALHVDGKRASDLVRSGKTVEIPARPVNVYSSKILEIKKNDENKVLHARIEFSVSKGTYIRSLARDIGKECKSRAYLSGLYRKSVGSFRIEDAAGFQFLKEFSIDSAVKIAEELKRFENLKASVENQLQSEGIPKKMWKKDSRWALLSENSVEKYETQLQDEVLEKSVSLDRNVARECGFDSIVLKNGNEKWFRNGGKLSSSMFVTSLKDVEKDFAAVFTEEEKFAGLLEKKSDGRFGYSFVNPDFF